MKDLESLYVLHIAEMADSIGHKIYMLNNEKCFREWVEENHPERIEEIT